MGSLNKVMLIGNLGADPEVRHLEGGQTVANLRIATNRAYKTKDGERKDETEWHRVVLWGRLGEIAEQYLKKGSSVFVEGRLQTRKWQDKDGNDRYTTDIIAGNLSMLDKKGDTQGSTPSAAEETPLSVEEPSKDAGNESNKDKETLDDLPF